MIGVARMTEKEKPLEKGIPGRFDYLEHTADVYIVAYGNDLLEMFENAGLGLFETMVNTNQLEPVETRKVESEGFDLENLLYRWLEDLLSLYYIEGIVCREVKVYELTIRRENNEAMYMIRGECIGEVFNPDKHESRVEVKAVTYHLMKIVKDEEKWKAYFVLDI